MNLNDLENIHVETCLWARELMRKKNSDYASTADPFANFKMFDEALVGLVFRLGDKLRRLHKVAKGGTLANEKVEDTFLDVINYVIIFKAMWEEEKNA